MRHSRSVLLAALLSLPVIAQAAEPAQCATVNFSDVGWTDITVTTAVASTLLDALGYKTKTTMISVPVTYKSLADGKNMDVFLGNWMPTMENDIKPYRDAGTVDTVRANLENAKYTLAVPEALYNKGLKDFADLPKFKQELDGPMPILNRSKTLIAIARNSSIAQARRSNAWWRSCYAQVAQMAASSSFRCAVRRLTPTYPCSPASSPRNGA